MGDILSIIPPFSRKVSQFFGHLTHFGAKTGQKSARRVQILSIGAKKAPNSAGRGGNKRFGAKNGQNGAGERENELFGAKSGVFGAGQPGGHGAEGLAAVRDGVFDFFREFSNCAVRIGVGDEDRIVAETAAAGRD